MNVSRNNSFSLQKIVAIKVNFLLFLIPVAIGVFIALCSNVKFLNVSTQGSDYFSIERPNQMHVALMSSSLVDRPIGEDGFYMLTVAWNLAKTNKLSYNFVKHTTGIQPLQTFIFALLGKLIIFLNGNKIDFIKICIVYQSIMFSLFCFILIKLINDFWSKTNLFFTPSKIAILLVVFLYPVYKWFLYGLETSLYLTLFAVYIYYFSKWFYNNRSINNLFILSILAGLTCLARIDFCLIIFIQLTILLLFQKIRLKEYIIVGAISFSFILPWMLYCFLVSGTPLPSSAGAQSALISKSDFSIRFFSAISASLEQIFPWIRVPNNPKILISLIFLISCLIYKYKNKIILFMRAFIKRPDLLSMFVAIICVIGLYVIFIWATHFYARYFIPLAIISILFWSFLVYETNFTLISICLGLLFFGQMSLFFLNGFISNSLAIVADKIPQEVRVGVFQSGVIGFFNENVINLDGKIDHEARKFLKKDNIISYAKKMNIALICDETWMLNRYKIMEHFPNSYQFRPIKDYAFTCIKI